jgi:hypothetical protein
MTNELIGAIFASTDAKTQAEFFNGLGRQARLAWNIGYSSASVQCAAIMDHLDDDGKKIIRELADMVGSEEEEARRITEKRQAENARIVSDAEIKLREVTCVAEAWRYEGGEKEICSAEILEKLETKHG